MFWFYILLDIQNSVMDQYQCLSISSKCCFLLTAVRGMHSDPALPNKHLLKEYDNLNINLINLYSKIYCYY